MARGLPAARCSRPLLLAGMAAGTPGLAFAVATGLFLAASRTIAR